MITNKQLVDYCERAIGCEYWYGCFGNRATEALLKTKRNQYPQYYNRANYTKGWTCDGRRVYDCIGIVKAAVWSDGNFDRNPAYKASEDYGANSMLKACKVRGPIKTLPEVPGVLVFKPNHVGVYIGNGKVIHAAGHNYGVIKANLNSVAWTDWGYCPLINYGKIVVSDPSQVQPTKPATPAYTHTVIKAVNVRTGPAVYHKRVKYADYPAYIRLQFKGSDCLPAGTKIKVLSAKNGWYQIGTNMWIAGNFTKKI